MLVEIVEMRILSASSGFNIFLDAARTPLNLVLF